MMRGIASVSGSSGGSSGVGGGRRVAGKALWETLKTSALTVVEAGDMNSSIQLANALGGSNDAQYLEDSISPSTVRQQLTSSDILTNHASLIKAMKWLLASVSKGRNVSDFFPHVVKLVACPSLEVRKMVYVYLQQYANYNDECRELALLSINAFQRALSDQEPYIRALALRVMTCIHVPDVLQIQILAVQTCLKDSSPYVRKCAANAIMKLHSLVDDDVFVLEEALLTLLETEESPMVLSSAVICLYEMNVPLMNFHSIYRKLCHWLVDMEDAGQVIVMDLLSRYCRQFFMEPHVAKPEHSATLIDDQRRIHRPHLYGSNSTSRNGEEKISEEGITLEAANRTSKEQRSLVKKVKRRVVRKAFYSDEEDESSEEEVQVLQETGQPLLLTTGNPLNNNNNHHNASGSGNSREEEYDLLEEDHALLLTCSLPLFKSRNAAVVMAVASLHYYCGLPTITTRSTIGKALVRIYHDSREIQYVVLTCIRRLAQVCPSAFTPYLPDFFVKGMDPSFTRLIKLEILLCLALEPSSITACCNEFRTYIRHDDKVFCCASIQAVGHMVHLAHFVLPKFNEDASLVALNGLHGITALTHTSSPPTTVVTTCISAMCHILLLLFQHPPKDDPHSVMCMAIKRLLVLTLTSLSGESQWEVPIVPPVSVVSALSLLGQYFYGTNQDYLNLKKRDLSELRLQLLRGCFHQYPDGEDAVKCASLHLAHKACSKKFNEEEVILAQGILECASVDVSVQVRDVARTNMGMLNTPMSLSMCPPPTWLPMSETNQEFRFGTLSSLVHHAAGNAYVPLPPWATHNSPSTLREPPQQQSSKEPTTTNNTNISSTVDSFYDSEDDDDDTTSSEDDDTSSDDDSEYDSSSEDEDEDDDDDDDSSSEESESEEEEIIETTAAATAAVQVTTLLPTETIKQQVNVEEEDDDDDDSSSSYETDTDTSEEEDSSDEEEELVTTTAAVTSTGGLLDITPAAVASTVVEKKKEGDVSSLSQGLEGLVMTPLVQESSTSVSSSSSCSHWKVQVRPELSGGLLLQTRFMRDGKKVEIFIANKRTDNRLLRRIRVVARNNQAKIPPNEMSTLKPNQSYTLTTELLSSSSAQFHLQTSHHATIPFTIQVPLGETLEPITLSQQEFDDTLSKLTGIHQRSTYSITKSSVSVEDLQRFANLTKISDTCCAAKLNDLTICVQLQQKQLIVACDNTMILNNLMEVLKQVFT